MNALRPALTLAGAILSLSAAASPAVPAAASPAAAPSCGIGDGDLRANARLSFEAFDQTGAGSATARALGNRGCFREAAAASEDYLVNGPILSDYQRNVVRWHMGQYLANAGEERQAARIIAATRRDPNPARPDFDWNAYVVGTWAFLVKDRRALDAAHASLTAKPGFGNVTNAKVLGRLARCFRRSYREALESKACEAR